MDNSIKINKKEDVLMDTALNLKPKYIVIGEVSAAEAQAVIESMETGRSTICSMNNFSIDIVNKLITKYLK